MRVPRWLFLLAVAACASEPATRVDGLTRHARLYSAFDGEHAYRVVLTVAPDVVKRHDPDSRVDWTNVRWTTDPAFVDQKDFPELAGAALLTTKRVGKTRIGVSLETTEGARLRGETTLEISAAASDEWQAGDDYYNGFSLPIRPSSPEEKGLCGFPETIELPTTRACGNCHSDKQLEPLGGPCTPLDTAEYPDDALIATFAHGAQPRGGFTTPFLNSIRPRDGDSACVFSHFHRGEKVDEQIERGLLWKVRSLDPIVPKTFDPELINHIQPDAGP